MDKNILGILDSIYYNPKNPHSFGTVNQLYLAAKAKVGNKVRKSEVEKYLSNQDAYTLHRRVVKRFARRKYLARYKDDIWHGDLLDLQSLYKENKVRFILVIIDTLSRMLFVNCLKNKSAPEVLRGFKDICRKNKIKPNKFCTDRGKEFFNNIFHKWTKENHIHHYTTFSEIKSGLAERVILTLKQKLFKYMTATNSLKYVDQLDNFVHAYNNTPHSALPKGMSPSDVSKRNEKKVWQHMYKDYLENKSKKFRYKIGQKVRISKTKKNIFEKGYLPGFTKEIFEIIDQLQTNPVTYRLKDQKDEAITGSFYERELVPVDLK